MDFEFSQKLSEFEIEIVTSKIGEVPLSEFNIFFSILKSTTAKDLKLNKSKISFVFVELLKKIEQSHIFNEKSDDISNLILELVTFIAVMIDITDDDNEASEMLIFFLHNLNKENFNVITSELYSHLSDIINSVSWVFKVKIFRKNVFPVHELISKVAENFEYSNESLMHLTMALQIFKDIDENFEDSESEQKIKNIANKYNIGILACLINSGMLLSNSEQNYKLNSTLIAKNKDSVIIRNVSKTYFNSFQMPIFVETNESGLEMSYFVKITLESNWKFVGFEEYMLTASPKSKREFLSYIFKHNTYNILFSEAIIVDVDTNEFIRLLNLSKNDSMICADERNYENTFNGFYESLLQNTVKNVRTSILYGSNNSCNIVTFDFILALKKYLDVDINKYDLLSYDYCDSAESYQNRILISLFEYAIKSYDISTFCKFYENYYYFLEKHLRFDDKNTIKDVLHLVLPFDPYIPFQSVSEIMKWIYVKNEYEDEYTIEKITVEPGRIGHQKFNSDKVDITHYKDNDSPVPTDRPNDFYVVINNEKQTLEFDEKINNLFNFHEKMIKLNNFINCIDIYSINTHISDMVKLIKGTNIQFENYTRFGITLSSSEDVICIFKLMWHFALYSINNKKIEIFYDLIFKYHHTDSILCEKDWENFFDGILSLQAKTGVLLIAKERSSDSGTLVTKYNEYHNKNKASERAKLSIIFDGNELESLIEEKDGKLIYKGSLIEKIIFVTDNITHGRATQQLLEYHIKRKKDKVIKKFIELPEEKDIQSIIEKNNIQNSDIEIHCLYCFESTKCINIDCENSYQICSTKIIDVKHSLDDSIIELYKTVYGNEPTVPKGIICMIRYNNMPFRSVFPDNIKNTLNIIGLFNRKKEQLSNIPPS